MTRSEFGQTVFAFGKGLGYVFGFILHIWTLVLAYKLSGLLMTIVTFFIPVFSWPYWFIKVSITDSISNPYCLSFLIFIPVLALMYFGKWLEPRVEI